MQETKKFLYPPEVRAVLAQVRREQRLRAKQRRAEAAEGFAAKTATAPAKTPLSLGEKRRFSQ